MIFSPNWAAPSAGVTATQSRTGGTAQVGIQIRQFPGGFGPIGVLEPFGDTIGTGGATSLSAAQRWTTSVSDSGWQAYCDTASILIGGTAVNTWVSCDATQAWVISRTVPSFGTNTASGLIRFRRGGVEYGSIPFTITATAILP